MGAHARAHARPQEYYAVATQRQQWRISSSGAAPRGADATLRLQREIAVMSGTFLPRRFLFFVCVLCPTAGCFQMLLVKVVLITSSCKRKNNNRFLFRGSSAINELLSDEFIAACVCASAASF